MTITFRFWPAAALFAASCVPRPSAALQLYAGQPENAPVVAGVPELQHLVQVQAALMQPGAAPVVAAVPETPPPPPPPGELYRFAAASGSYLGVGVAEVDAERAKALKLPEERGVEITNIEPDSAAEKAGLKKGDVVLEFNGQRVEGTEQFMRLVRETPAGRQVRLQVFRNGGPVTVAATTASRKRRAAAFAVEIPEIRIPEIRIPEIHVPDVPRANMSWRNTSLGIEAEAVESQLAEFFGVKSGVLVRSVVKGSAAEKAGLKAGDVILKLDDVKVSTPREISSAVRSRGGKTVPITLVRERRELSVSVTLEAAGESERRPRAVRVRDHEY